MCFLYFFLSVTFLRNEIYIAPSGVQKERIQVRWTLFLPQTSFWDGWKYMYLCLVFHFSLCEVRHLLYYSLHSCINSGVLSLFKYLDNIASQCLFQWPVWVKTEIIKTKLTLKTERYSRPAVFFFKIKWLYRYLSTVSITPTLLSINTSFLFLVIWVIANLSLDLLRK